MSSAFAINSTRDWTSTLNVNRSRHYDSVRVHLGQRFSRMDPVHYLFFDTGLCIGSGIDPLQPIQSFIHSSERLSQKREDLCPALPGTQSYSSHSLLRQALIIPTVPMVWGLITALFCRCRCTMLIRAGPSGRKNRSGSWDFQPTINFREFTAQRRRRG